METVQGSNRGGKELDIARIRKYLTNVQDISLVSNPQGAEMYRIWDARSFTLDADKFFREYVVVLEKTIA